MYYDDVEYAARRLSATLVRKTNGNPFYIMSVRKDGKRIMCTGHDTLKNEEEAVSLVNIDLTPVPLGFLNLHNRMSYLCRKPMRKDWRQGLSFNSLVSYGLDKRDFNLLNLTDVVLNRYSSFGDVYKHLTKQRGGSMAFSRDFGMVYDGGAIKLCYRKYIVGRVEGGTCVLNPDKFFLEQHLAESMG